jgi:hypothetical protein
LNNDYIHIGCGLCAPANWRNFDASPTLRLQKIPLIGRYLMSNGLPVFPKNVEYGDIVKGLPVDNESCHGIYCSHVLEHLAFDDYRIAIKNIYSLLLKNGVFRFVMPDLEYLVKQYIQSDDPKASLVFMEKSLLGIKSRPRTFYKFLRSWLGNSQHLWMWDYKTIDLELKEVGFHEIKRVGFGDSEDMHFKDVEVIGQWNNCLGVECRK